MPRRTPHLVRAPIVVPDLEADRPPAVPLAAAAPFDAELVTLERGARAALLRVIMLLDRQPGTPWVPRFEPW